MIISIISFILYQLDQRVLTVLAQKMWETFFKPVDQLEQEFTSEALDG